MKKIDDKFIVYSYDITKTQSPGEINKKIDTADKLLKEIFAKYAPNLQNLNP